MSVFFSNVADAALDAAQACKFLEEMGTSDYMGAGSDENDQCAGFAES
jgi:hypothetical protein